jgi:hypothetical protein
MTTLQNVNIDTLEDFRDVKVSGEVIDEEMKAIHKLCSYSPMHAMMAETNDPENQEH